MTPRNTYFFILVGALLWCGLIVLAPYLASISSHSSEYLYRSFQPICHQLPERSFHIFGEKLAVCSRCASIYIAFLFGISVYPVVLKIRPSTRNINPFLHYSTPERLVLLLAMLPMVVDVGLDMIGVHQSDLVTRTITGAIFGVVGAFFVLPAALEGVQQIVSPKPTFIDHQKGISNA